MEQKPLDSAASGPDQGGAHGSGSPEQPRRRRTLLWLVLTLGVLMVIAGGLYVGFRKGWLYFPDGDTVTLKLPNGVTMEFVRIPAGKFMMGSPENEPGRDPSESPQHQVEIKKSFFMSKYPVTQEQWSALRQNQSMFRNDPANDAKRPCESVSWGDVQKYCEMVSSKTHRKVRLPSEAEWEYACRAGTTTAYAFGSTITVDQVNFKPGEDAPGYRKTTTPVGMFKPNAWGLYDMHGNVWQWCLDVMHDDYTGAPTDGSAWMTGTAEPQPGVPVQRVRRGGSYKEDASTCRSAIRWALGDDNRNNDTGFRLVVEAR